MLDMQLIQALAKVTWLRRFFKLVIGGLWALMTVAFFMKTTEGSPITIHDCGWWLLVTVAAVPIWYDLRKPQA